MKVKYNYGNVYSDGVEMFLKYGPCCIENRFSLYVHLLQMQIYCCKADHAVDVTLQIVIT
jgi:hypothetical protein